MPEKNPVPGPFNPARAFNSDSSRESRMAIVAAPSSMQPKAKSDAFLTAAASSQKY
jgi:hypothetical protein